MILDANDAKLIKAEASKRMDAPEGATGAALLLIGALRRRASQE
jgi:hypothetical protein